MPRTLELRARVTALSSITHNGGQSYGITSMLRRERFVQTDGSVEEVPVISGNGIRGMLRDKGMYHMCRSLGYGVNEETGEVQGLSLPAYYFLFSGGVLSKEAGKALNIDRARELRRLIPLVGIFGGAVGNMIMPGKVRIDKMIPICQETMHLLPDSYHLAAVESIWEYTQREMYTRKDDEKNENLRVLIEPQVRGFLEDEAATKRARGTSPMEEETGSKQQMMYFVETLAAGTSFAWSVILQDVTDAELEAFVVTLAEFSKAPYIGGKSGTGLGKVAIEFKNLLVVDSRMQADTAALGIPAGDNYKRHLQEHGNEIRDILRGFE